MSIKLHKTFRLIQSDGLSVNEYKWEQLNARQPVLKVRCPGRTFNFPIMDKMENGQKAIGIILLIFLVRNIDGKFLNESFECNTMNNEHWNLIQWFYGKTDKVCVTFIASSPGENQHSWLQDKILRELFQSMDHKFVPFHI